MVGVGLIIISTVLTSVLAQENVVAPEKSEKKLNAHG